MLYRLLKGIAKFIFKAWSRLEVNGIENIPQSGPLIIVANHVNIIDPILLGISCPRQIHFMAKSELFEIPLLKNLILALGAFPVNRGKTDFQSVKNSLKVLNNGGVLGIFPQGGTRKKDFEIIFRSGTAAIALKSKSVILPVGINGTRDGLKVLKFGKIRVNIGKPITWTLTHVGKIKDEDIATLNREMEKAVENLLNIA